jgi:uncharacterized membrane protein
VNDWPLFVGRFHPLLVHLPIGFLILAALLEVIAARRQRLQTSTGDASSGAAWGDAAGAALLAGAGSAVIAVTTGYLLGHAGGYGGATFDRHQVLGIVTAVVAAATTLIWAVARLRAPHNRRHVAVYRVCLAVLMVLIATTGHLGGTLTHGEGYLTDHAPEFVRSALARVGLGAMSAPKALAGDQAVAYTAVVEPILRTNCIQCHRGDAASGGLALDTPAGIRKGGDHGAAVVAGRALSSEIIRRIWLTADDKRAMPPRGRPPLRPSDATILQWWIDQGAPFDKRIADLEVGDEIRPILEASVGLLRHGGPTLPAVTPGPLDPAAVKAAEREGFSVVRLDDKTSFVEVNATNAGTAYSDRSLGSLRGIAPNVVWLDLAGTSTSDDGAAAIAALTNLTRLHLSRTRMGDAGLARLGPLQQLEYLNLYGTRVTDAGLQHLSGLRKLKRLYVWQTAVTPAGVERLRAALPGLVVDEGAKSDSTAVAH